MSARDEESRVRSSSGRDSADSARTPRIPGNRRPAGRASEASPVDKDSSRAAQDRPPARPSAHRQHNDSKVGQLAERFLTWYREKPYSRETVVGGILGAAFLATAGRLFYLQAIATGDISTEASSERTANHTLPYRRGAIYDRNGNVLARSVDAVNIAIHPNVVQENDAINATANLIAEVLGGDASTYADICSRDSKYEYLVKNADPLLETKLKEALETANLERKKADLVSLSGFEYEDVQKRVYTQGEVAGNIIGIIGGDDNKGITGLELQYDDVLSGTDGYLVQERSRDGNPIVGGEAVRIDPVDGENIVVSIDLDIQRVAQEQIAQAVSDWGARAGMCIVMNPENGEIYACVSTPYLDLSNISAATTEAFNVNCVSGSYEPGSTFKPITASAAIDLGIATPTTNYYCPSSIQVGDDWVGDSDKRDYDIDLTLTEVLERSSNVGMVECAESLGAANFYTYTQRFKIGSLTEVDYPGEVVGIVPKYSEYTGAWASMAFGQALAVPPIQMARAISAIANDGVLVQPHFLVSVGGTQQSYPEVGRAISADTARQVSEMMYSVIENGYGKTGKVEGYRLSGKTGTAERVDDTTGRYFANTNTVSFIGFGPTDDPKVLVYVMIDYVTGATGSEAAGPVWAVIMKEALDRLQIPPSY